MPCFTVFLLLAIIVIADDNSNGCHLSSASFVPGAVLLEPLNRPAGYVFSQVRDLSSEGKSDLPQDAHSQLGI